MKKIIVTISTVLTLFIMLSFANTAYGAERINIARVELSQASYTYTGKKVIPQFKVYDENGKLVKADRENYTYLTSDNINVGKASIRVKGRNKYQNSITVTYNIKPRAIKDASINDFNVVVGRSIPKIQLSFNKQKLVEGTDFTYTVTDGKKAGKYVTYKIIGKGNFFGTKSVKKVIRPKQVWGIKSSNRTFEGFDISWKSQAEYGVKNYKVYIADEKGNPKKLVADTDKNSATIKGFKAGDYVYVVVRGYVTVDGNNNYGNYSKVFKTVTKPQKVTISSATKSNDKTKITVNWEKAPCTGYELQYTTDKKFKSNVKTININGSSKVSKSISVPKSSKIYYVRVRAYRQFKYNGKTKKVNGPWSVKLSTEYSKVYEFYKTPYPYNPNRTTNLKLAAKAINGTILKPGDTFSFNKIVGQRTSAKGYKPATIFTGSSGTAQSTGGGICQIASTIFNAALYCNLTIVERHQHSQRVAYCPLGRDAAIFWGSEDLKFKNTSGYPLKIEMKVQDGYVYCDFKVSYNVSPPKVKLEVSQSGNHFTLKRYADGKCNYTAYSTY